jgi:hypothetical protein
MTMNESAATVYQATQALRAAADALHANRTPATLEAFRLADAAHTAAYAADAALVAAQRDAAEAAANDKYYAAMARRAARAARAASHKI